MKTSETMSTQTPSEHRKEVTGIDDDALYGEWLGKLRWQDALEKKLAHKSLNIPEEMAVNADNRQYTQGMTWKDILALGLLVLGVYWLYRNTGIDESITQSTTTEVRETTQNKDYEIRFYDRDGNLINVPHISEKE